MCGMRKPLPGMSILVRAASAARAEFKRKEVGVSTWGVYEELGGSRKDYYKEFRNQEGYILLSLM